MNADAKALNIRWRRLLFVFHLLLVLLARLAVGSIDVMPPPEIYNGFAVWAFVVAGHALLVAVLDGRDRAAAPFAWMETLINPRERRWTVFGIDALAYTLFTIAIANRVIPERVIMENPAAYGLLWVAHTGIIFLHILLLIFAEVRDRAAGKGKRKNDMLADAPLRLIQGDDGELIAPLHPEGIDWIDMPEQKIKRGRGE